MRPAALAEAAWRPACRVPGAPPPPRAPPPPPGPPPARRGGGGGGAPPPARAARRDGRLVGAVAAGPRFWPVYERCAFECLASAPGLVDVLSRTDFTGPVRSVVYVPATSAMWLVSGNHVTVFDVTKGTQEVYGVVDSEQTVFGYAEKAGVVVGVSFDGYVRMWDVKDKRRPPVAAKLGICGVIQGDVIGHGPECVTLALLDDMGRIHLVSLEGSSITKELEFSVFSSSVLELYGVYIISQPLSLLVVDVRGCLTLLSFYDGHTITSRSCLGERVPSGSFSVERSVLGVSTLRKSMVGSTSSSRQYIRNKNDDSFAFSASASSVRLSKTFTGNDSVLRTLRGSGDDQISKVRLAGTKLDISDISTVHGQGLSGVATDSVVGRPVLGGVLHQPDKRSFWLWSSDGKNVFRLCVSKDELVIVSKIKKEIESVIAQTDRFVICQTFDGRLLLFTNGSVEHLTNSQCKVLNMFTPSLSKLLDKLKSIIKKIKIASENDRRTVSNLSSFCEALEGLLTQLEVYYDKTTSIDTPLIVTKLKEHVNNIIELIRTFLNRSGDEDELPDQMLKLLESGNTEFDMNILTNILTEIYNLMMDINKDIISPRGTVILSQLTPYLGPRSFTVRSHLVGSSLKNVGAKQHLSTTSEHQNHGLSILGISSSNSSAVQPQANDNENNNKSAPKDVENMELKPITVTRGNVQNLIMQINELQNENKDFTTKPKESNSSENKHETLLDGLKKKYFGTTSELHKKLAEKEEELEKLKKELVLRNKKDNKLLTTIQKYEMELQKLNNICQEKNEIIQKYETELERQTEDYRDLVDKYKVLNEELQEKDKYVHNYKDIIEKLRQENTDLENRNLLVVNGNKTNLESIKSKLSQLYMNAQETNEKLMDMCGLDRDEIERLVDGQEDGTLEEMFGKR